MYPEGTVIEVGQKVKRQKLNDGEVKKMKHYIYIFFLGFVLFWFFFFLSMVFFSHSFSLSLSLCVCVCLFFVRFILLSLEKEISKEFHLFTDFWQRPFLFLLGSHTRKKENIIFFGQHVSLSLCLSLLFEKKRTHKDWQQKQEQCW